MRKILPGRDSNIDKLDTILSFPSLTWPSQSKVLTIFASASIKCLKLTSGQIIKTCVRIRAPGLSTTRKMRKMM